MPLWRRRRAPAPSRSPLPEAVAERFPLPAFALLSGGDLFDPGGGRSQGDALLAEAAVSERVRFSKPAPSALVDHVRAELVRQLAGHAALAARMRAAKPIVVDIVPSAEVMIRRGFPRRVARSAAGLFWNPKDAPEARIALRADHLEREGGDTLVVHEYAHAIHALGMSERERRILQGALRRVFPDPQDQTEAFAIYSERELMRREGFTKGERACPGVYGRCRRLWDEEHAFAAFVKKLYRPGAPVRAGDRQRRQAIAWRRFAGG